MIGQQQAIDTSEWDAVVTVHGFVDNYQVAERIKNSVVAPRRGRIRMITEEDK